MTEPAGFAVLSCAAEFSANADGEGNAAVLIVNPANSRRLRRESFRGLRPVVSLRSDFMLVSKLAPAFFDVLSEFHGNLVSEH